jgi:hypothetical protein
MGIPIVFDHANARFELLKEPGTFENKDCTHVNVTYVATAGDFPDDYSVLLIDPVTKVTRAAYYIVTSPLVSPNGPSFEKLITLDGLKDVNGLMLASGHRTFSVADGKISPLMRHTDVSAVAFLPRGSVDLSSPESAKKL